MADPELVKLLQQGSKVWNDWREQHPDIYPDLSYANLSYNDLSGRNLSHAYLGYTNLNYSYLGRANLSYAAMGHADLGHAKLIGADLVSANLNFTDLVSADLSGANLRDANLMGADLVEADLSGANLSTTNLHDAIVGMTIFSNMELCEVKGLVELRHQSSSRVELHTILLPQDGSALHFLRGAGVPDEWIDFYRAQMIFPIQYHSCFISYAHQDEELAHRLHSDLQDSGIRCWFAPHDMHIGDKIRSRIDEAIHLQDKLLLILSEEAVNSDWVEHEVETALATERRDRRTILLPIRLDNAILEREHTGWAALVQNERHIGDFTGWKDHDRYQAAFEKLMHDLKKADE